MSDDAKLVPALQAAAIRWMVESHVFWTLAAPVLKPEMFEGNLRILFQVAKLGHRRHVALLEQDIQHLHNTGKIDITALVNCHYEIQDVWAATVPDERMVWEAIGRTLKHPLRTSLVSEMIEAAGKREDLRKFVIRLQQMEDLGVYKETNSINVTGNGDALVTLLRAKKNQVRFGMGNPDLDRLMKGGPPLGTLTVYSAGTGVGKSLGLGQTVAYNNVCGKEVVTVSLELDHGDQAARIISPIIGLTIDQVIDDPDRAVAMLEKLDLPPLHIIYMDEGVSVEEIEEEIKNNHTKTADVIAIDYLDLIGGGVTFVEKGNDYKLGGRVAKDLRKWAKRDNVQLYSASQPQRQAKKKSDGPLGTEDLADSQNKARVSDQVISFNLETGPDGEELVYGYTAKFRTGIPRKRTPAYPKGPWGAYGCVLPCPAFTNIPLDAKGVPIVPDSYYEYVNTRQLHDADKDFDFE